MIQDLIEWAKTSGLSQWLLVLLVFFLAATALTIARRLLWRRLERWAASTSATWDDELLGSISGPIRALLLIAAIGIAGLFAPLAVRSMPGATFGIKIALIITGIWLTERSLSAIFRSGALSTALTGSTRLLVLTLSKLVLFSIALLVVLDTAGISITPILASLGVGSVAVALALQDTLSNFFSGLYLLADRPIRIGDFVKIENGVEGHVVQIGWRSTHIRMLANNTVVIPNLKIAAAQMTNFDMPEQETAVLVPVGVSYDSDLSHVEKVTCEVGAEILGRVPGGIPEFSPFIRYHTFGESSIDFNVILRAKQYTDGHLIKHEFVKALHERYRKEAITIPYPQRVVHTMPPRDLGQ